MLFRNLSHQPSPPEGEKDRDKKNVYESQSYIFFNHPTISFVFFLLLRLTERISVKWSIENIFFQRWKAGRATDP